MLTKSVNLLLFVELINLVLIVAIKTALGTLPHSNILVRLDSASIFVLILNLKMITE